MVASLAGDAAAYRRLLDELSRHLRRYFLRRLGADRSADADDLSAEHVIEITPTSGSECNVALAALGGAFSALPCEARYLLSGSLDTSGATTADSSDRYASPYS